ncbi:MAG: chromate transporter [Clostridia bacterium]|nr:chromate transporter [Clostridia bacterium]
MIYLELFLTFLKIGAFTFGGGYAMLPLIREEVLAHGWIGESDLVDFVAVSESTPGPFAINMATYVGSETGGFLGALCATFGVVLPSFVIILIVAKIYDKFKNSKVVRGCMSGLKPAVVGLIGATLVSIGATVFFPAGFNTDVFSGAAIYISLAIFALSAFVLFKFKKVHPIAIIGASAALGIVSGYAFGLPL